jgi:signal transduction histidine kinase
MKLLKRFERQLFPAVATVLVAGLVCAVWGIGMRETSNRRLYLELEAYRTLTALSDLVRAGALNREDMHRVVSFGLYTAAGQALYRYGNAPTQLEPVSAQTLPSRIEIDDDSLVLYRLLGNDYPGRRPPAVQMGRRRRDMSQPMGPEALPALAYLDYSSGNFVARQTGLYAIMLSVSCALLVLYAVLIVMYTRYITVSDREARNRELVELGEAARTIVHEIKNPLGVIRIQCGLLRRGADQPTLSGLAVIEDEVLRLTLMADRIRAYLSPAARNVSAFNLRQMMTGFQERYAATVIFNLKLTGEEVVVCDVSRVMDSLDNIIANARDVMAGMSDVPEVAVYIKQQRVVVEVSDKGPGVPPEIRKKLFEPFFTTKPRGTGLGLALARKNVEACGGSLSYVERSGGGSVFTFTIPLARHESGIP